MKRFWIILIIAGIAYIAMSAFYYYSRPSTGDPAPNFSLQSLDEKTYELSDLKGSPVIVHFWATWCDWCVSEFETLVPMYEKFGKKGLVFLALSEDGNGREDIVRAFLKSKNVHFPVLMDIDGRVADLYQSNGLPETIFISKDGIIINRVSGALDWTSPEAYKALDMILTEGGNNEGN